MANHPIFAPTFHGNVERVRELLEADSTLVSVRDAKNLTPLHVAASRGQAAVAQLLIDYGADIHGPSEDSEWTPLIFAAYRGHLDVAKVLVENGAGVSAEHGNPIHYAGQRQHKDICRLLVEHGAVDDRLDSDDADVLALFRAAYSYRPEFIRELLERRPDIVNVTDKQGRTALHEACTNGDTKTVRVLLRGGADVTIQDKNKQVPADRAASHRQYAVTKLLKNYAETKGKVFEG